MFYLQPGGHCLPPIVLGTKGPIATTQKLNQGLRALFSSQTASPNMRSKVPQPVQAPIQRRLTDVAVAVTTPAIGVGTRLSRDCRLCTLGVIYVLGGLACASWA
jgi:hypothetical protein